MLDARTHEWLSRLQSSGPKWVSLALAALIAVELARIAIGLIGPGSVKSPQPSVARAPQTPRSPGVDVSAVIAAHFFGMAAADPSARDPANAPPSTANLVLAGTIATQDPQRGVAIISDGGPAKVFAVGDNVGGASLHSVYLDRVILDRGGNLETLMLPHPPEGDRTPRVSLAPAAVDPRTVQAVANIRRLVQQDPGILDQVMRAVPSYDNAAGKLRGFRAYPGRNRAIFNKLGLKPGDLVTAVNGTALDDPQRSQEVFNTIQTSDHVTVSIERGGQKQDITLNIAQVASQATKDLDAQSGAPPAAIPNPAASPVPPNSTNENLND